MSSSLIGDAGDGCATRGKAAGPPAASLLCLAATPTFVTKATWSAAVGGPPEMICNSGGSPMFLNGMAAMYALMSVFHVSPWLTLLSNWRNDDGKGREGMAFGSGHRVDQLCQAPSATLGSSKYWNSPIAGPV